MNPVSIASVLNNLLPLPINLQQPVEAPATAVTFKDNSAISRKESSLTFVSANFERMPIFFLCTSEERERLQKVSLETKTPIEIVNNNKGEKLSISPSGTYGLPAGFDQDVLNVYHYKLDEAFNILGECPSVMRLWLGEFRTIMKREATGPFHDNIRESIRRLDDTTIYHENFLRYAPDNTGNVFVPDRAFKLLHFLGTDKAQSESPVESTNSPVYIDIKVADWHRASINARSFSTFDIDLYFSLPSDRSKRLYMFLETIRYKKETETHYSKLSQELHIDPKLSTYKRALKRAFDPLVDIKFLKGYSLDEKVTLEFSEIKKVPKELPPLTIAQRALILDMEELIHEKNTKWIEYVVRTNPPHVMDRVMGETRMAVREGRIHKTPGAYFNYYKKYILKGAASSR